MVVLNRGGSPGVSLGRHGAWATMEFRDQRPENQLTGMATQAPSPVADAAEIRRQAVIAARFRCSAATAALLAELAFPTVDDRRRS